MRLFTPKTTITFGLVSITVSTMIAVMFMGIGPNMRQSVMAGRAKLCESIAIDTSIHLSRNDLTRIRALMENLVKRNGEVKSAGVRRTNGKLVIDVNNHVNYWQDGNERSTETHVTVPLRVADNPWGMVEMRFRPIHGTGFVRWLTQPWVRYIGITAAIAFIVFSFYLSFVLRQLDPSEAVPKRVRTALDSLAEGLLVTDEKGRVILANQAFATWSGRRPEKLVGRSAANFPWMRDSADVDENDKQYFPWVKALQEKSAQAGVLLKLKDHENNVLTIVANSSPVLGSDGEYRGVLTSFEDVTELEKSKIELIQAKTAADEANRSKSEFLAHMSHEIRTPMNAILGYTEVLRSGSTESIEDQQKHLKTIQTSGQHLLSLINDILDLSKIESGKLEMEVKRCSLRDIFAQIISVMKIKSDEKQILLGFDPEGALPKTIMTDEVRLQQTLINLVGNAIKFTDQGGVGLMARLITIENRPMLQIDVADTGIGMTPEAMKRIFDPFSQADNSITRRFGGTGLGLSISLQLAEKLGGKLEVSSVLGQGSKFTLTIDPGDLSGVEMVDIDLTKQESHNRSSLEELVYKFPGNRLLIVDDSETNRELVALFLRRSDAKVEMAENGQVAVDKAKQGGFDAILMDMQMPVKDGFTATRELRELGVEIPIIALTANVMKDDEDKCRAAGCSDFLPKPVSKPRLLEMLAHVLPHTCEKVNSTPAAIGSSSSTAILRDSSSTDLVERAAKVVVKPTATEQVGETLEMNEEIYAEISGMLSETAPLVPAAPLITPVETGTSLDTQIASLEPLVSSLPMDDEDYRMIVEMFIDRLQKQILDFRSKLDEGDFKELANLAHWLKGSGGTAGFESLTEPAKLLQDAAEADDSAQCGTLLTQIEGLVARITAGSTSTEPFSTKMPVEPEDSSVEPLYSSLPMDDEDFRMIVEMFIGRLQKQMPDFWNALVAGDYPELANLAHWLKGSGGTAGFDCFTEPAKLLQEAAEAEDAEKSHTLMAQVEGLVARVSIALTAS